MLVKHLLKEKNFPHPTSLSLSWDNHPTQDTCQSPRIFLVPACSQPYCQLSLWIIMKGRTSLLLCIYINTSISLSSNPSLSPTAPKLLSTSTGRCSKRNCPLTTTAAGWSLQFQSLKKNCGFWNFNKEVPLVIKNIPVGSFFTDGFQTKAFYPIQWRSPHYECRHAFGPPCTTVRSGGGSVPGQSCSDPSEPSHVQWLVWPETKHWMLQIYSPH